MQRLAAAVAPQLGNLLAIEAATAELLVIVRVAARAEFFARTFTLLAALLLAGEERYRRCAEQPRHRAAHGRAEAAAGPGVESVGIYRHGLRIVRALVVPYGHPESSVCPFGIVVRQKIA